MKKNTKRKIAQKEEKVVLLKFLKRTKSGNYGPVEKSSLPYSRREDPGEFVDTEEVNYYYSLS
jgi:hypothetical protein